MRRHEAGIEAVVRNEFRQGLSGSSENIAMEFDDRKRRHDREVGPELDGHFALDRQMREVVEVQSLAVPPDLALEEAASDRPFIPNCCVVPGPVQPTL